MLEGTGQRGRAALRRNRRQMQEIGCVYLRVYLDGASPAGTVLQDFRFVVETVGEPEEGPIYLVDGATAEPTASPSASPTESASPSPSAGMDASGDPVDAAD